MINITKNGAKVVAVLLIAVAALFYDCDDPVAPQPPDNFGTFELIYELDMDVIPRASLADVSDDNQMYIVRGYIEEPVVEQSLWYVEPPDDPVMLGTSTENWWGFPVLSLDKKNIAYEDRGGLYVIPISGGAPYLIFDKMVDAQPFQWLDNETVMFSSMEGDGWYIKKVNVNTLEVDTIIHFGMEVNDVWQAHMSPDGKYLGVSGSWHFRLYDLDTGEYETFDFGQSYCYKWSPDGSLMLHGNSYFDLSTGKLTEYSRNEKLELSFIYGAWTPDGKKAIFGEKHYYGQHEYDKLRIYEVTVIE
jgi:hypothetical protein